MFEKLVDRLVDLVYRRDFEYSEFQGALLAIVWGSWMLNPWANVFGEGWRYVAAVAPDQAWGAAFLLCGLGQLAGLLFHRYGARRLFALCGAILWLFTSALLGMERVFHLAFPTTAIFFIGASWGYLRIGMTRKAHKESRGDRKPI